MLDKILILDYSAFRMFQPEHTWKQKLNFIFRLVLCVCMLVFYLESKDLFPWLSNQKISGIILIYFIVENLFEIYSNRRKKKTKRVTWQAGFFFVKIYTISSIFAAMTKSRAVTPFAEWVESLTVTLL